MSSPFEPVFVYVKVSDPTKDGEIVKYTVASQKVSEDKKNSVVRQYEDFEWLHHCLVTQNNLEGVIVPPLPPKPLVEPYMAEKQTKEKLGTNTKLMKGDQFEKDSKNLERYLWHMVAHSAFGTDTILEKFFVETEAPSRAKVKKDFFNKVTSAVNEVRKGGHKDVDDQFHQERDWLAEYSVNIKDSALQFNKVLNGHERLAQGYAHLANALNMGGTLYQDDDKNGQMIIRMSKQLAEAYEDAKGGLEADVNNGTLTLGHQLDLYARYADSEKDMLFRRICLLIAYEDANKALEKAKPLKRPAAEEAQVDAEKAYQKCTEKSRNELKNFHHERVLAMQSGLVGLTEIKLKTARDTYAVLAKSLTALKQIEAS